jgi:hypothetical protein
MCFVDYAVEQYLNLNRRRKIIKTNRSKNIGKTGGGVVVVGGGVAGLVDGLGFSIRFLTK